MKKTIVQSVIALCIFTFLAGAIYPCAVTFFGQLFFPHQANGSPIALNGQTVGSELIGQAFTDPCYFWSRPSATTPPYNSAASSGSNLGPLHPDLKRFVQERIDTLHKHDPAATEPVPVDLVTASGSGLDPHVSPAAARYQIGRIARIRGLDVKILETLIAQQIEGRQLGFLGEPRVNILKLNIALNRLTK